ncbi:hypothetical protein RFI_19037 [Reticulomyxa filosa]|uniref:Uncharacterized protein n=1 Tax=Reticulomyxa filosa TaxID=46433 RepID=X6MWL8_RETFI|nr:hypothetical protein RFI_19037 [Reticulomyxa filosa]|eukprot:ETO18239.1 hypothetical protein RFI_19037 [Reticulomyxa filosa]
MGPKKKKKSNHKKSRRQQKHASKENDALLTNHKACKDIPAVMIDLATDDEGHTFFFFGFLSLLSKEMVFCSKLNLVMLNCKYRFFKNANEAKMIIFELQRGGEGKTRERKVSIHINTKKKTTTEEKEEEAPKKKRRREKKYPKIPESEDHEQKKEVEKAKNANVMSATTETTITTTDKRQSIKLRSIYES